MHGHHSLSSNNDCKFTASRLNWRRNRTEDRIHGKLTNSSPRLAITYIQMYQKWWCIQCAQFPSHAKVFVHRFSCIREIAIVPSSFHNSLAMRENAGSKWLNANKKWRRRKEEEATEEIERAAAMTMLVWPDLFYFSRLPWLENALRRKQLGAPRNFPQCTVEHKTHRAQTIVNWCAINSNEKRSRHPSIVTKKKPKNDAIIIIAASVAIAATSTRNNSRCPFAFGCNFIHE